MPSTAKDRLATEVVERRVEYEQALFDKRRRAYPVKEFNAFWEAGRRYAELTKTDPLIHRNVVRAIHGLTDIVGVVKKRVPAQVEVDAERLECLLFSGYDPYFEGDEPPGL
jgi:hypothetical protein